jgi:hypothetical protein
MFYHLGSDFLISNNIELLNKIGYNGDCIDGKIFKLEYSKDNVKTFQYDNGNGKKIYISSLYNTEREIDNLLKDVDFDRDNLFIVYGIGMGCHIKEIYNRMTKFSYILVIEKDKNILSTYMKYNNFSELVRSNVLFFFGDEKDIINRIHSNIGVITLLSSALNTVGIILPAYRQIYSMDFIYNLNSKIIEVIKHIFFLLGNDVQDTIYGFENYVRNIKELLKSPDLNCVKDKYRGKPAIIVSAGPSLDKNVQLLKKVEGKALILATDAVLGTLKKYNIVSDGVFSVERVKKTYEAFYKDKKINEETVFIGPTVVRKEILDCLRENKKLLFLKKGEGPSMWIGKNIVKKYTYLTTGASCAHTAFSFARFVGADPIIFVGQDLAYTKDGVTHGSDVEIKKKVNIKNNAVFVDGLDDEKLPTSKVFKNFLIWFEKEISKDKSGRKYIDCTEGGALKKGTIIMRLKDAIDKYCNKNIVRLNELVPDEGVIDDRYINSIVELKKLKAELKGLLKKSKKHNRKLNRFLNKNSDNNDRDDLFVIDKGLELVKSNVIIEKIIFSNELFSGLFQPILISTVIKVRNLGCSVDYDLIKDNMKIQMQMNKNIVIGCKKMLGSISKLINGIIEDKDYINLCKK